MMQRKYAMRFSRLGLALLLTMLMGLYPTGPIDAKGAEELPHVVIVTTGGAIAQKTDPKSGGAMPALSGQDLVKAVPGLGKVARITVVSVCNIDSSQMSPEIWVEVSRKVDQLLLHPGVSGAVVTHGTDTMAEGAYFLDLTLASDKPVVFTGAMRDASDLSPDGPVNLLGEVILAASDQARGWGVTVALNQYVNAARDVVKTQTTNPQTFEPGEKGYLGYIQSGRVHRFRERGPRVRLPLPAALPEVVLLTTFAGDDGSLVRFCVDQGVAGLVIEAVGAGNVNAEVFKAVEYALARKVAVVITSRVAHGAVYPIYGDAGGGLTLQKAGAILGGDLPGPKARLLLMLALAQTQDRAEIKKLFER